MGKLLKHLKMGRALPAVSLVFLGNRETRGTIDDETCEVLGALIRPHVQELPGLLERWQNQPATRVYAVIDRTAKQPVGLVAWTGPDHMADPSWWIHEEYRGRCFGTAAIDALAVEMKRLGVRALKSLIKIQTLGGQYDAPSEALERRLRASFYLGSTNPTTT